MQVLNTHNVGNNIEAIYSATMWEDLMAIDLITVTYIGMLLILNNN